MDVKWKSWVLFEAYTWINRETTQEMENLMEKKMEHDMETGVAQGVSSHQAGQCHHYSKGFGTPVEIIISAKY